MVICTGGCGSCHHSPIVRHVSHSSSFPLSRQSGHRLSNGLLGNQRVWRHRWLPQMPSEQMGVSGGAVGNCSLRTTENLPSRNSPNFRGRFELRIGSSSLNADVDAFERLPIVRDRNSSYFGSKYGSCSPCQMLRSFDFAFHERFVDDQLHCDSVSSLLFQASTCFRSGSELRCIRSTRTEMQSMSENDFECFARTGVKSPKTTTQFMKHSTRGYRF
jgi:hypothetical protein